MKRQNIVPAIIMLAAILLSTFVLADVPIPTTDGDEPTDGPTDDEIVVEGEANEEETPRFHEIYPNSCWERASRMADLQSDYERWKQGDIDQFNRCTGCRNVYATPWSRPVWDCEIVTVSQEEFDACVEMYTQESIYTEELFDTRRESIASDTKDCGFSLDEMYRGLLGI